MVIQNSFKLLKELTQLEQKISEIEKLIQKEELDLNSDELMKAVLLNLLD